MAKLVSIFIISLFLRDTTFSTAQEGDDLPCSPKAVGDNLSNIVCVCNVTYCDSIGTILPSPGKFIHYQTSKSGLRLQKDKGIFQDKTIKTGYDVRIVINRTQPLQKVLGFGGAFTDAAGLNIESLSEKLQTKLLKSYFGETGIGYTIGRIPIGGCDFSTREYTYDDFGKWENLSSFSLQAEDYKYKIPFIKVAKQYENNLWLFGSPWTAPPWMKTNKDYKGRGFLKKEYRQLWADYFIRFLDAYKENGVELWGLTAQNEPFDGLIPKFPFNCMGWTASMQRDWVRDFLGPTLKANGYQDMALMILDDNTLLLESWVKTVLSDKTANQFVAGIGVHWYTRALFGYKGVEETRKLFPDKFILSTEACSGFLPWEKNVDLGSWDRGEDYAEDIIQELRHGASGWVDWNLALDLEGGPNWANMGTDSSIIVNKEGENGEEFYKQPMFYAIAHFSKFFPRGSFIIQSKLEMSQQSSLENNHSTSKNVSFTSLIYRGMDRLPSIIRKSGVTAKEESVLVVAALRPDNAVTVGLLNKGKKAVKVSLQDETLTSEGKQIMIELKPKSISTVIYQ